MFSVAEKIKFAHNVVVVVAVTAVVVIVVVSVVVSVIIVVVMTTIYQKINEYCLIYIVVRHP